MFVRTAPREHEGGVPCGLLVDGPSEMKGKSHKTYQSRAMRSIFYFTMAAFCNGISWWGYVFGQVDGAQLIDLVQLGGTGGLIVAMIAAIAALWRDRNDMRKELAEERERYRNDIAALRVEYRSYIQAMQKQHHDDIDKITEQYTEELRRQIEDLKEDTRIKLGRKVTKAEQDRGDAT